MRLSESESNALKVSTVVGEITHEGTVAVTDDVIHGLAEILLRYASGLAFVKHIEKPIC